jgi:hypothetical protein
MSNKLRLVPLPIWLSLAVLGFGVLVVLLSLAHLLVAHRWPPEALCDSKKCKEAREWIAYTVTVVVLLGGLFQYWRSQLWKRAEFVAAQMAAFFAAPAVRKATQMIDWAKRRIDLYDRPSDLPATWPLVSRRLQCRALLPHTVVAGVPNMSRDNSGDDAVDESTSGIATDSDVAEFTRAEAAIRDAYDGFFGGLETFSSYVNTGLVSVSDLRPYLNYWLGDICSETDNSDDDLWTCCVFSYIAFYEYRGVQELFRAFGYNIDPCGELFRRFLRRVGRDAIGKALYDYWKPRIRFAPEGSMWLAIPVIRALGQQASEVVTREPGDRFLSAPQPIAPLAKEHWEFAWLSDAAYQQTAAGKKHIKKMQQQTDHQTNAAPTDPQQPLAEGGWTRWKSFPDDGLLKKIETTHLRVQVWERNEPPAVAVTFGGTVFNNDADWRANLRWFPPWKRDEYTDVVQKFAPAFRDELNRLCKNMDTVRLSKLALFSTGHSLGGGLAQQFAYSVPFDCAKRVKQVYAFDPSPVTGFFSVARGLRNENKRGLLIDRIYERGEILARLRSLTSLFYRPSTVNAAIRGVRYNLFRAWNAIAAHSIIELAVKIDAARREA